MKAFRFVPAFCAATFAIAILLPGHASGEAAKETKAPEAAKGAGEPQKAFSAFGVPLTPEQATKFKTFTSEAMPKKRAIAEDKTLSEAEKRTRIQAIYKEIREKLRAILTPEQIALLDSPATAYPQKREGAGPAKAFGVTLTPEQAEKFKAINAEAMPKKKAIRENAALSEAEKRTQMLAVYKEIREKLKAILTPDQLKQMEAAPVK